MAGAIIFIANIYVEFLDQDQEYKKILTPLEPMSLSGFQR